MSHNTKWQPIRAQRGASGIMWVEPTLLNGWVTHTAGQELQYAIDSSGVVHFRGRIKEGSTESQTVIFILPEKYRPDRDLILPVTASSSYGTIYVRIDGEVRVRVVSSGLTILDGLSYPVSGVV